MMGSASSGVAIYGPKHTQNIEVMAKFFELICFDNILCILDGATPKQALPR